MAGRKNKSFQSEWNFQYPKILLPGRPPKYGKIHVLIITTLNTSRTPIIITTHNFMSLYLICNMVCNMVCKISCTSGPFIPLFVSRTVVKMVTFWNINPKQFQTVSKSIFTCLYEHHTLDEIYLLLKHKIVQMLVPFLAKLGVRNSGK